MNPPLNAMFRNSKMLSLSQQSFNRGLYFWSLSSSPSNQNWSCQVVRRHYYKWDCVRARRGTRAAGECGEGRRCAGSRSWAGSWWRPCRYQQSARDDVRSRWGCGTSGRDSRTECWRYPLSVACQERTFIPSRWGWCLSKWLEQLLIEKSIVTSWLLFLWSTLPPQLEMLDPCGPVWEKCIRANYLLFCSSFVNFISD